MKGKHLYTSDQKLEWLGGGEWVEEVDFLQLDHKGITCKIARVIAFDGLSKDGSAHIFGGHLCGYVKLPDDHPWIKVDISELCVDCHGGVTYKEKIEDSYWIGFDCAHSMDVVPSMVAMQMEIVEKTKARLRPLYEKNGLDVDSSPVFAQTYRNIRFCKKQCRKLAVQVIESYEVCKKEKLL